MSIEHLACERCGFVDRDTLFETCLLILLLFILIVYLKLTISTENFNAIIIFSGTGKIILLCLCNLFNVQKL